MNTFQACQRHEVQGWKTGQRQIGDRNQDQSRYCRSYSLSVLTIVRCLLTALLQGSFIFISHFISEIIPNNLCFLRHGFPIILSRFGPRFHIQVLQFFMDRCMWQFFDFRPWLRQTTSLRMSNPCTNPAFIFTIDLIYNLNHWSHTKFAIKMLCIRTVCYARR